MHVNEVDLLLTHSIFDKLDAGWFAFVVQLYANEIDAPLLRLFGVVLQVIECRCSHPVPFRRSDGLFRSAKLQAGLSSHFDEDEAIFLPGNDVNLSLGAAVISFNNTVAPFFEKIAGKFLTQDAGIFTLHFFVTLSPSPFKGKGSNGLLKG